MGRKTNLAENDYSLRFRGGNQGEAEALVLRTKGGYYLLQTYCHPISLSKDLFRALGQGHEVIRSFEEVSWKVLKDLASKVQEANSGKAVDFQSLDYS